MIIFLRERERREKERRERESYAKKCFLTDYYSCISFHQYSGDWGDFLCKLRDYCYFLHIYLKEEISVETYFLTNADIDRYRNGFALLNTCLCMACWGYVSFSICFEISESLYHVR